MGTSQVVTVMKYGIGYDLVVVSNRVHLAKQAYLVLGIRCHQCQRISFHPKDIQERYCGACHVFHEANLLSHEG